MRITKKYRKNRKSNFSSAAFFSASAALAAAVFFFSACNNEPIFATIESEIELRDPSLEGTVTALVQYENYLYACNGRIKRKHGKASPGSWETVALPDGTRCAKLVVIENGTSEELYGLFQGRSGWAFDSIQKYDGNESWEKIHLNGSNAPKSVQEIAPSTNGFYAVEYSGPPDENNPASSFNIYEYNGSSWTKLSGDEITDVPIGLSGSYIVTKWAPYKVSGTTIQKMPVSESSCEFLPGGEADIMGMCTSTLGGTTEHFYVLTDDYIWHYNGSIWNRRNIGTSYEGFGMPAVFYRANGQSFVLLPLEEGYREASINNSTGEIGGVSTPGSSTSSTVAPSSRSQYRSSLDDYAINFMYAVTDSDYLPDGCSYAVYASVGHYKYSGLWGYYESEAEWNRE